MSLDGAATTLVEKELQYLNKLKDAVITNGSQMQWVSDTCVRAMVSLNAFIQVDVLGGLSDFNDQYPNATPLTKVRILKEFLEKEKNNRGIYIENDTQYPIDEITETLQKYVNNSHAFDDALDKQLTREKFAGRVSLFANLKDTHSVFSALCHVTLLQTMQRFLDESEQKDEQLQQWVNTEKEKCFDKEIAQNIRNRPRNRPKVFLATLGYSDFNSFFQGEYENLRDLISILKRSFTRSFLQEINVSVGGVALRLLFSFLCSASFIVGVGRMALLPQRFFFTAMRVGINASGELLRKLLSFIINPNGRVANRIIRAFLLTSWCVTLIFSGLYFGVNLSYLLGIQNFPNSWSASSIFTGYIIYAGMDFSSYLAFKGIDMVRSLATSIRSFFRRGSNTRNDLVQNQVSEIEKHQVNANEFLIRDEQEAVEMLVPGNLVGNEITSLQRRALIRLLMAQRETQSPENKRLIAKELIALSDEDKPYYLSSLDKRLIENENRGAEFGLSVEEADVVTALPLERVELSERQRIILARMLILNRDEISEENQGLVSTELNNLGYRSMPYYLSTLDRRIISRENREAEFGLTGAALQSTPLSEDETPLSPSLPMR